MIRFRRIARESWLLAAICVADLITTLWFVQDGAVEANPIMRHYLEQGILPFVLAKSIMVLGPLVILEWARTRNPRFVRSMLRIGICLYLGSYGTVVWQINHPAEVDGMTIAQQVALERWASSPASPQEMAAIRSEMR